ncbi:MAG: hypothetical protein HC871_15080 [Rhizobiales bacterium]|nr:hypothetical protein [Hyphomicrobiales bacterium]
MLLAAPAAAQGLSPMTEDFATYANEFAFRLNAKNPYHTAQRFSVAVYEADWRPSSAAPLAPHVTVPPGETVSFLVRGETDSREIRTLYVCVRSEPFHGAGSAIRGEACGRYRILQRRL